MRLPHAAALSPRRLVGALPVVSLLLAMPVRAAPVPASESALFALIIGVNRNPERDQPPLHYADDDAARYLDLFQRLGASTALLATLDENTRGLHPRALATAQPARQAELRRAVTELSTKIREARARGQRTTVYVIYAGHGEDDGDRPTLTLEDGNLGADQLLTYVVTPLHADAAHV